MGFLCLLHKKREGKAHRRKNAKEDQEQERTFSLRSWVGKACVGERE